MCWFEYEKFNQLESFVFNMYPIFGVFLLVLMVGVSTVAHATHSRNDEKRVALVVGNSAYRNVPVLPNPGNDAEAIGSVLKRLNFDVDFQINLTKPEMDTVLRRFGDRSNGAAVSLFYYAGHGLQVAGTNYLIPID
jgi:hypothetical protein